MVAVEVSKTKLDSRTERLQEQAQDEFILRQLIEDFSAKKNPKWKHQLIKNN